MSVERLRAYTARWGRDFMLAQGAGGNTSIKDGNTVSVKASGYRLSDAENRDIFVDVPLAAALAMLDGAPAFTDAAGRRASIETSLHAVMPHRIVAHLHMIPLLAIAVRSDAKERLAECLRHVKWAFIPYLKPGVAVAQAVQAVTGRGDTPDVIVLANHGVVFGGDDFEKVQALIDTVQAACALQTPSPLACDILPLQGIAARFGLELPRLSAAHHIAGSSSAQRFASAGSLYPDHVVFLGRGAGVIDGDELPLERGLFVVPGKGALLLPNLPDEAHEMAACLGEVVARIDPAASVRTLSHAEEDELIDWDAERYRRDMAHAAS
jgi:rhamnose utilization protein RhaD (predicted bifunctional aldolase and dehydrogenase)